MSNVLAFTQIVMVDNCLCTSKSKAEVKVTGADETAWVDKHSIAVIRPAKDKTLSQKQC